MLKKWFDLIDIFVTRTPEIVRCLFTEPKYGASAALFSEPGFESKCKICGDGRFFKKNPLEIVGIDSKPTGCLLRFDV